MQLKEIKEKVKRPTKFTSLAISEAERLLYENNTLKNEIGLLKKNNASISDRDMSNAIIAILNHYNAIDNFNRSTRNLTDIGKTKGNGSIIHIAFGFGNPRIEIYDEDVSGKIKPVTLQERYKDLEIFQNVSRYVDSIENKEFKSSIESSLSEMSRGLSKNGGSITEELEYRCGFNVCNDTSNCGALFIYGIEDGDQLSGEDFIRVLESLRSFYSKRMFFGSDWTDGGFYQLLTQIKDKVSVEECIPVRNSNSGNDIFTFQIYL